MYVAFYAIAIRNWLPNSQKDSITKRVVVLLKKVVEMVEFDLGQLIFYEITKFDSVYYEKFLLPFPSLIFKILSHKTQILLD